MKLITWNVNSIRVRAERLLGVLQRHDPDVVCLQELKVQDDAFPHELLAERGYDCHVYGQKTYNGVAILGRGEVRDVVRGFVGDPKPEHARVISATVDGTRVINVYVVNGQAVGTDKYALKLDWLDALYKWIRTNHDPDQRLLMAGDFNIAPEERDVYAPQRFAGKVLFSLPERKRLQALLDWGLYDLLRVHTAEDGLYSWWDYRHGAFHRGWGLRLDLILGTAVLRDSVEAVDIDREERKPSAGPGKPSDHAPVIVRLRK
jgi:exodeoxyribonuclease-3